MLNRNELLQFEKQLLAISNENSLYSADNPFQSILEREYALKKQKSTLSTILDTALEQTVPVEDEDEDFTASTVTDDMQKQEDEDSAQSQEQDTEEDKETGDDEVDESIQSTQITDNEEKFVFAGFTLPDKYKQITDADDEEEFIEVETETSQETEIDEERTVEEDSTIALDEFSDIYNFNLAEYEAKIESSQVSIEIKDKQIQQLIDEENFGKDVQEEDEEGEQNVDVYFEEGEEGVFFNNLETYNIFLQRAIIEIINTRDDSVVSSVVTAVINKVSTSFIHRSCEAALGYSVPLFENTTIYTFDELSIKLSTLSDTVIRAARNFFLNILPKIGAVLILLVSSYVWGILPLRAWWLYRAGYDHLLQKEYDQSESLFRKASSIRYIDLYYFSYAEEYIRQELYTEAEKKYEQLLFGLNDSLRGYIKQKAKENDYFKKIIIDDKEYVISDSINYNRKGFLELISFMRNHFGNNAYALILYDMWLLNHNKDVDFILGKAETYIDMYDVFLDDQYLLYAQDAYGKMAQMKYYSIKEQIPALRWAVRSQSDMAIRLINEIVINENLLNESSFQPHLYSTYTDTMSYLLQGNNFELVPKILEVLLHRYPEDPLLYFIAGQYAFRNKEYAIAMKNFEKSKVAFEQKDNLNLKDIYRIIELHVLQAEMLLEDNSQSLLAEQFLNTAQILYENQLMNSFDAKSITVARLYFYKAKLRFNRNELDQARQYLQKSIDEQYNTSQVQYLYALTHYAQENWNEASRIFLELLNAHSHSDESRKVLLISSANTLFRKENFEAAIVQYVEAIQLQERIFKGTETVSLIKDKLDIFTLDGANTLAYLKNNIGVSYFKLYQRDYKNKKHFLRSSQELHESHAILKTLVRDDYPILKAYAELPVTNLSIVLGNLKGASTQIFDAVATELPEQAMAKNTIAMSR